MNKYLIKLANHLDKKGLHKEADYVDWIIKNADQYKETIVSNEKMKCINLFTGLQFAAAQKNMEKYKKSRDEIIELKENGVQVKEILEDFNKKLAGAYYFAKNNANEKRIEEKFEISGKDAISKINKMIEHCSK